MKLTRSLFRCSLGIAVILALTCAATFGQARSTLRGLITDELGAAIVGANVTLTDANGVQKKTTTNSEGVYTFSGLTPFGRWMTELWYNARPMLLEIGVPSLLMGCTFPLANALIQRTERAVGSRAGALYLANTAGAVFNPKGIRVN